MVSSIEYIKLLKFEKSGGNIREKISLKYLNEFEKRFIKLISRSIETVTNKIIIEAMKTIVFQVHCGLKYFSNLFLLLLAANLIILLSIILII